MIKQKWIVHPYAYGERGHREISVIHESFTHGLRSYGWFNVDKKLISQDSMYGNMDDGAYKLLIKYAEDMASDLNAQNVQPDVEVLKNTKQQKESLDQLAKGFMKNFDECLYEALTKEIR